MLVEYSRSLKVIRDDITQLLTKIEQKVPLTYNEISKFNRLKNLEQSVNDEMRRLGIKSKSIISKSMSQQYTDAYTAHQLSIEKEIGISLKFGKLNPDFVKARVALPLSGADFSQLIGEVTDAAAAKIKKAITRGIIQGKSIVNIRDDITKSLNGDTVRALRVARTETLRAMSQGHLDAYDRAEELGIKQRKIWLTKIDTKTRDDHVSMDGQSANDDGIFEMPDGTTMEAPHIPITAGADQVINCRCDFIIDLIEYDFKKKA